MSINSFNTYHLITPFCTSYHASNTLSLNDINPQLIMLHIKELTQPMTLNEIHKCTASPLFHSLFSEKTKKSFHKAVCCLPIFKNIQFSKLILKGTLDK